MRTNDPRRRRSTRFLSATLLSVSGLSTAAVADDAARLEFFESRIRPVLVDQCYSCHNSTDAAEGGLAIDHRAGLRKGGDGGAAIALGSPRESLLVKAIRHEIGALRMPQDAPQLDARIIADFEQWIADGAVDPRDEPPSADELSQLTSWEAVRDRRLRWWSFQPIVDRPLPDVQDLHWSDHPIDRFLQAKMESAGLTPAPVAERRPLIRRLAFALTGLPPTPLQIDRFLADEVSDASTRLIDELLASEHFGERWARHWMDWLRYAETHGSEGDPAIPFAWRYRDYLIRALNADVQYDQLVREHIAGDLLPDPRINVELGINESRLGAAQYRFVQHGFAPTDALDEQVRFTENQIDVISKAFLGLTISCARCHDHKFDPISQKDFYALYGVMVSSRPATVTVDTPARQDLHREKLSALKDRMRMMLAVHWLAAAESLTGNFQSPLGAWTDAITRADDPKHPLHAWSQLQSLSGEEFGAAWSRLAHEFEQSRGRLQQRSSETAAWRADLSQPADFAKWFRHGAGLRDGQPALAGEFSVMPEGEAVLSGILPAGVYTNRLSTKHNGVLASRRIHLDAQQHLYLRVRGDGEARARYVVQHYPRRGTVYPLEILKDGRERWIHWDLTYWEGDEIDIEVTTAADMPVELQADVARSSFGVTEAVRLSAEQVSAGHAPVDEIAEFVAPLFTTAAANPPGDAESLAALYAGAVATCVTAWRDGTMSDEQARFLDVFVRENLLPNRLGELPMLAALVDEYRALETEIPVPTRAPGVLEADVIDQPLFTRGNHKQPGEAVSRRFLEAFGPRPYGDGDSGRLELAEDILRPGNPLTARVIVNRVWHHLIGRGLVATPDNFGHLGAEPSHPELLDWLAVRFVEDGWSLKKLIRLIVTSRTYQLDSTPTDLAAARDSANVWLSHAPLRRLEAESIRDAMLAATGELDSALFGQPDTIDSHRRSVYLAVRRNDMIPLLTVFDQPTPFSTQGRRDITNVPG
ncbi:MAG: PSD1 and planctomycete cytochrome C domain-containing protein, partial [Planctomycetaceae bacterium]